MEKHSNFGYTKLFTGNNAARVPTGLVSNKQAQKIDELISHITAFDHDMTIIQVLGWPVAHQRSSRRPQRTAGLVMPN